MKSRYRPRGYTSMNTASPYCRVWIICATLSSTASFPTEYVLYNGVGPARFGMVIVLDVVQKTTRLICNNAGPDSMGIYDHFDNYICHRLGFGEAEVSMNQV